MCRGGVRGPARKPTCTALKAGMTRAPKLEIPEGLGHTRVNSGVSIVSGIWEVLIMRATYVHTSRHQVSRAHPIETHLRLRCRRCVLMRLLPPVRSVLVALRRRLRGQGTPLRCVRLARRRDAAPLCRAGASDTSLRSS
jgi:hypothetical protein